MSYKKFEHFLGRGNNAIRRSPFTTCYVYICNYYSGGKPDMTEYYFSPHILNRGEVEAFESEMKLENPNYERIELSLDIDHPFITYIWSALDD